ncbi:HNH endonuclease signature motif containing protein [Pleomorphomonas sp. PLEO]|uniref:HNH endonuclease signature motif containing protein n=1 Tax=Pleomorphomonas sp. PLEO TaxID=3239306 RepID=UPI00351F3FD2
MTERRRLTTVDKLKIIVRQAMCPICGERLGGLDGLDFDHEHALARGGADTIENLRAVHRDCHRVKTSGAKATSHGSDIHEIAKTKRLAAGQEEFRRRLLTKEPGKESERSSKWPSRPLGASKKGKKK